MYGADVEQFEYEFPLLFRSDEFRTDSGGAGKWRGGLAVDVEFGPVDSTMVLAAAGVGDKFPASGAAGARSRRIEPKLNRRYLVRTDGMRRIEPHRVVQVGSGETVRLCPQGGGGVGDPLERDPGLVRLDVVNGFVSIQGAAEDYGVIIDPQTFEVDLEETRRRRYAQRD
jgi:N-methylhydantoinase B